MDPVVWGPPLWALMHSAALRAPRRAAPVVERTLDAMERTLPCAFCRASLAAFRPALARLEFEGPFEMLWMLHNTVSTKLQLQGGMGAPMSFERAKRRWATATEPVSELQLLNALIVTAGNYRTCPDAQKRRWYAQLWRGIATLCTMVPTTARLGADLLAQDAADGGCALLRRANERRSALLRERGLGAMAVSAEGARRRIARGARGAGGARAARAARGAGGARRRAAA